ncbi:hypothetical protein HG530_002771 [Fusarium avenaceum]|nr:hypothetical protein HG530_002771 [Fusarium avenaceum]
MLTKFSVAPGAGPLCGETMSVEGVKKLEAVSGADGNRRDLGVLDLHSAIRTAILGKRNLTLQLNTEVLQLLEVVSRTAALPQNVFRSHPSTTRKSMVGWLFMRITCLWINIQSVFKSLNLNGWIFYNVTLEMPTTGLSCVTSGSEMGEFVFVWQTSEDASRSDETG